MQRKMLWAGSFFLFFFLFWSTIGLAQDKPSSRDFEVYTLGEVVVKAKKQEKQKMSLSYEVTAKEIAATDSHTVSEVLSHVPGINVTTSRKNEAEIHIHGFSQDHIKVLIDGVPYYESKYGKLDLSRISTDNIAKIIIEKGVSSVLYGANAEAGVINIITKKPSEKPSVKATAEFGEKSAKLFSFSHGMKKGILNYWLNYSHQEADAWKLSDGFSPREGTIIHKPGKSTRAYLEDGGFRNNSDYKNDNLWAKVGLETEPGSEYYLNFHYLTSEKGDPSSIDSVKVLNFKPPFSEFDRIKNYDNWGADLSGMQNITDRLKLTGKLFYHHHMDDYVSYSDQTYQKELAVSRYEDYLMGGMLLADYAPVDWDQVKMALHYGGESHKERNAEYLPFAESFSYTGSVGLENTFTYIKNLTFTAGVSYDWFNVDKSKRNIVSKNGDFIKQESLATPGTKDEWDLMAGANYTFSDKTQMFVSVAKKTRFPTLHQLYSSKGGNIALNPERSINYVAGISRPFGKVLALNLSFFYHDVSDRISRDAPHLAGTYYNYAKVKMTGFEFTARVTPLKDLFFNLGYTYNDARDESPGRKTDKLLNVPKHKINMDAQYTIPRMMTRLDCNFIYISETYSQLPTPTKPDFPVLKNSNYTVVDGKITQPFLKHCEGYLAIKNIFDEDYEPESGFPAAGRSFWVGLTAKW